MSNKPNQKGTQSLAGIKEKMRANMINPNLIHGIQFCIELLDELEAKQSHYTKTPKP